MGREDRPYEPTFSCEVCDETFDESLECFLKAEADKRESLRLRFCKGCVSTFSWRCDWCGFWLEDRTEPEPPFGEKTCRQCLEELKRNEREQDFTSKADATTLRLAVERRHVDEVVNKAMKSVEAVARRLGPK